MAGNEWEETTSILSELHNDSGNTVHVHYDSEEKVVSSIFIQLHQQKQLYVKYGRVLQMDGTYKTNNNGFALYTLLCEDNNGTGQPIAFFFIKEETEMQISNNL